MKTLKLFGSDTKSLTPYATSQRRLNCYFEIVNSPEKGTNIYIRGTPGLKYFVTLPTSPVTGMLAYNNILYVVAGNVFYSVTTAGTITALGTMSNYSANKVSLSTNGLQILISNGTTGYIYTFSGSTFAVVSSNYTEAATSNCFLNGFFIVNMPGVSGGGQFQISNVYDGTTWQALQFATAETSPDVLMSVDALHGELILWGANHIEFWQDTGGNPFPFSQLSGTAQDWGLAANNSRAHFNNTIAFLGLNQQGQVQVMQLNGYQPQRISDNNIEHIINSFSIVSDAIAFAYNTDGHPMYQITFPSAGRSFLYEGISNLWSEVQTGTSTNTARHIANIGMGFDNGCYVSDSTTGIIYIFDVNTFTDNGTPIRREVETNHVELQGNKFTIGELWFDFQLGQGLQSGQGMNPQIMLATSKDNGETFHNERWTSIGMVGQYKGPRAIYRRFGQSRDFVFKITMTDPVPFVIIRASAVIEPSAEVQQ
jgi:hypothetical protein